MDWKIFATAFGTVFLAELGDKTQLAAFALSGGASSKWAVFIGASLALIAATALAVLAGGVVERYVPVHWIKRGAGILFIAIGVILLLTQQAAAKQQSGAPTISDPGSIDGS